MENDNGRPRVSRRPGDDLCHWGVKKDHKYVAKVKQKNGKYRYFYDKGEYQRYLKGKELLEKIKDRIAEIGDTVLSSFDKSVKSIKKATSSMKKKVTKVIDEVKDVKLSDLAVQIDRGSKYVSKNKKDHLYVAKVKLPNGNYRYFYSQKGYEAYLKRREYQENEPDFMKDLPEIDPGSIRTNDQEMAEINEDYDVVNAIFGDGEREMNCMYCTTAYELRQRGYDVEAADYVAEEYEGYLWSPDSWYENAKMFNISPTGNVQDMDIYIDSGAKGHSEYYKRLENIYTNELESRTYTGEQLKTTLESNNPPNSRGNLMVYWTSGGGHSMAWETDDKGRVRIRDCQTNEMVDINYLAEKVVDVNYMRTDNLTLKEGVLKTVAKN